MKRSTMALFILAAVSLILLAAPFTSRAFEPASPTAGAPAPANQPIEATTPPHVEETKVPAPVPPTAPPKVPEVMTTGPYAERQKENSVVQRISARWNGKVVQGWDSESRRYEGIDPMTGEPVATSYEYYPLTENVKTDKYYYAPSSPIRTDPPGEDDLYTVPAPRLKITAVLRDGSELTGKWQTVRDALAEQYGEEYRQIYIETYQNDLPANAWQPGTHRCTLYCFGLQTDFEVEVIENPVASVSASCNRAYYQGLSSYDHSYERYDPETGSVTTESFAEYVVSYQTDFDITVAMKDGTVLSGTWERIERELSRQYGEHVFQNNQVITGQDAPENAWQPGAHLCKLCLLGCETEVEVLVKEHPIADIKVTCNRDYYQGWDESERTEEIGTDPHYDFDPWDLELTVSMSDGTEIKGNWYYVESQLAEKFSTDQFEYTYDTYQNFPGNVWHVGENRCNVRIHGKSADFFVTLRENPVKDVRVRSTRDYYQVLDLNRGGEDADSPVGANSGYAYRNAAQDIAADVPVNVNKLTKIYKVDYAAVEVTVELTNGETITGSYYQITDLMRERFPNEDFKIELEDYQYDGNIWQLGDNRCTLRFLDREVDFNVTLLPNPVVGVSAKCTREYYPDIDMLTDSYMAPVKPVPEAETDAHVKAVDEYVPYDYIALNKADIEVTLSLDDGTQIVDTYNNIDQRLAEKYGVSNVAMSLETYQTPPEGSTWQQGRNKCTLSFPGFAADFEVTVTESPIKEITARAAHDLVDWFDDTAPKAEEPAPADPEKQPDKKPVYFRVDQNEVVVKAELKDGTVLEGTPYSLRLQLLERFDPKNPDLYESIMRKYTISYEEDTGDWQLGVHRCSIHYLGYDLPFDVTLVENPVASVEAVFSRPLTEGIDGRMTILGYKDEMQIYYDVNYYDYLMMNVRMKDGTVYSGTVRELDKLMRENYDSMPDFSVETRQDENHVWTVGENRCTLRAFGKETDFNVTLVPCPVADVTAKQIRPVYKGLDGEDYGSGYFRHDYKDALQFTLTFTDGREPVSGTLAELAETTGYQLHTYSNEDYTQWRDKDAFDVIVLCGREYTFPVTLSDAPEGVYGPGDVDGDGAVTSADARLALRASVQLERFKNGSGKAVAADVNHDGVIGSDDARLILRASVKLETLPLPEPAPANAQ